jgi:hypothetical protein
MSDEWIFFPCQMGDHRAVIFYDHGIRDSINAVAPPYLLKVRVPLKQPGPDGMPTHDEILHLDELEDGLEALAQKEDSTYVGRVVVDGRRHHYIYTPDSDEAAWSSRLDALGKARGYQLEFTLKTEEGHEGYWQELFPSDDDWQVIKDLRIIEVLKKDGDDGAASRRVDHWAYFPSQSAADKFSQWAHQQGYAVGTTGTTNDAQFRVCLSHEGAVRWPDITFHTIPLRRKATELGGEYDGWETLVCKASA